jgi:phospholipid/cholesterol/gamma-HCH transport system substrate-binding protein
MRRLTAIAAALLAGLVLVAARPAVGGEDAYEVRAIFDNATFIVEGEEVRIAGARVGTITDVDVTGEDEVASRVQGEEVQPGKAVLVMEITDPAFQDFREDGSCLIRPQSLLGEKFVECIPTQPRAAGSEPPPPLDVIPEGEPGEGQRLLPLENNGKSVDLDLVQNIQRLPYAERFRLILNELGAGLAARGEDLEEIIRRGNPALRYTNEVLAILARQNRTLAQLAEDGDEVLEPLARERERLAGFIESAGETAAAAAERRGDLEAQLRLLPPALRDIRLTMNELQRFSDAARPTLSSLGAAAPALTRATAALGPFSREATGALTSLGDAAEATAPRLRAADPIIQDLGDLAESSRPAATNLRALLRTLRKTGGYEEIMRFLFFTVGSTNGYDQYGHFLRAILTNSNCNDYQVRLIFGCDANFLQSGGASAQAAAASAALARLRAQLEEESPSRRQVPNDLRLDDLLPVPPRSSQEQEDQLPSPPAEETPERLLPPQPAEPMPQPPPEPGADDASSATRDGSTARAARMLMHFLMGDDR